ncbi:polyprotein [Burke-Gilman virus]|uniref:Genome polyprotein n=1 Tax=Krogivirus 69C1 TaxID=1920142 RepID=A0A1J0M1E2_9VIRU|nr:polyprotein [Burke-Gilman virus]APD13906.1 polyprotein [Krogivirus 69C1]
MESYLLQKNKSESVIPTLKVSKTVSSVSTQNAQCSGEHHSPSSPERYPRESYGTRAGTPGLYDIGEVKFVDVPLIDARMPVRPSPSSLKKFKHFKPRGRQLAGNLPRKHYRFVADYRDYSERAQRFAKKVSWMRSKIDANPEMIEEFDRQHPTPWHEPLASDAWIHCTNKCFECGEKYVAFAKYLRDQHKRRHWMDVETHSHSDCSDLDVGVAQAGQSGVSCKPQDSSRNHFVAMIAAVDQLLFTSNANREGHGNDPAQREANARRRLRRLIGAVLTFIRFLKDNGFVCNYAHADQPELDQWYDEMVDSLHRFRVNLTNAHTQAIYDFEVMHIHDLLVHWLENKNTERTDGPFCFVNPGNNHDVPINAGVAQSAEPSTSWGEAMEEHDPGGEKMMAKESDIEYQVEEHQSNVVFQEDRAVEHVTADVYVPNVKVKAKGICELPNDLENQFTRPITLISDTWSVTDNRGLFKNGRIMPAQMFMGPCGGEGLLRILNTYSYFNCSYEFTIRLNTIKANCGKLRMIWVPMPMQFNTREADINSYIRYPNVEIDASSSTAGVIRVPWQHWRSYFPIGDDPDHMYTYTGRLFVVVWNQLRIGPGSQNSVGYTVQARFVDHNLFGSHHLREGDDPFSDLLLPYTGSGANLKNPAYRSDVSTILDTLPELNAGIAQSFEGKFAAKAMEKAGQLAGGLMCDKPTEGRTPMHVQLRTADPLAHCDGSDHSTRLSLHTKAEVDVRPDVAGVSADQMDLTKFTSEYTRIEVKEWSVTANANARIAQIIVNPCVSRYFEDPILPYTSFQPSFLAYVARQFLFWGGTLVYRLTAVSSDMHTGRLQVRWMPDADSDQEEAGMPFCKKIQAPNDVWDIHEDRVVEVPIPMMSPRQWLRCDQLLPLDANDKNYRFDNGIGRNSNGILTITVLEPLRCPSIASSTIDINIEICGQNIPGHPDNFRLSYYSGFDNILAIGSGVDQLENTYELTDIQQTFVGNDAFEARVCAYMFLKVKELAITVDKVNNSIWQNAWKAVRDDLSPFIAEIRNIELIDTLLVPGISNIAHIVQINEIHRISGPTTTRYASFAGSLTFNAWTSLSTTAKGLLFDTSCIVAANIPQDQSPSRNITQSLVTRTFRAALVSNEVTTEHPDCIFVGEAQAAKPGGGIVESVGAKKQHPTAPLIAVGKPMPTDSNQTIGESWMSMRDILKRPMCFHSFAVQLEANIPTVLNVPCTPFQTAGNSATRRIVALSSFSQLYTFWKGSLRFKLVIPGSPGMTGFGVHDPVRAGPMHLYRTTDTLFMHESQKGMAMYGGNVMNVIEVESVFVSPYQMCSTFNFDEGLACQNGVIRFYLRSASARTVQCHLFISIGDVFNFFTPRNCPSLLFNKMSEFGRDVSDRNRGETFSNLKTIKYGYKTELTRTVNVSELTPKYDIENFVGIAQAGGEEGEDPRHYNIVSEADGSGTHILDQAVFDEVDGAFQGIIKVGNFMNSNLPMIEKSMNSLNNVLTGLEASSRLLPKVEKVIDKMGNAAEGVVDTTDKMSTIFNMTRIGGIVLGVYNLFQAEDWTTRVLALSGIGVALGVTPEIAADCVNWMFAHLGYSDPVWKVPQRKVNDVGSAQSFKELLRDYSGCLKWIASGIATFSFFSLFTDTPNPEHVKSFASTWCDRLKQFHFAGQAIKTAEWLFNWIGSVMQAAIDWAFDIEKDGFLARKIIADRSDDVLNWLDKVNRLNNEDELMETIWNPDRQQEIWKLMDQAKEMYKLVQNKGVPSSISTYISHGYRKVQELAVKQANLNSPVPSRIDPFCVCMTGESGLGKSSILATVMGYVGDYMDYARTHRCYGRNSADDFWTGYCGQPFVVQDDFAQDGSTTTEIMEFINMKSNFSMHLNMASLEEKGRPFRSHFILQTTNNPFPTPPDIAHHMAIWRRRNILLHVKANVGMARADDFSNLLFDVIDPIDCTRRVQIADLNMDQVIELICARAADHLEAQRKRVWLDLNSGIVIKETPKNQLSKEHDDAKEAAGMMSTSFAQTCSQPISGRNPLRHNVKRTRVDEKNAPSNLMWFDDSESQGTSQAGGFKAKDEWERVKFRSNLNFNRPQDCAVNDGLSRLRMLDSRLKMGDAQRVIIANDDEIAAFIASNWRGCKQIPTVQQMKDLHVRVYGKQESAKHMIVSHHNDYKCSDWRAYPDLMWSCVVLNTVTNKYEMNEATTSEVAALNWELGVMDNGEEAWQRICKNYYDRDLHNIIENTYMSKVRAAAESAKCWVRKWCDDHPKLFRLAKMLTWAAGLFLSWKIIKCVFPSLSDKIEEKVSSIFGVVSDSRPIMYVREATSVGVDKTRKIVNSVARKIKSTLGYAVEEDVDPVEIERIAESAVAEALKKAESAPYTAGITKSVPRSMYRAQLGTMESQGAKDKQANTLVQSCVSRALAVLEFSTPKGTSWVNVLAIRGQCVLAPWHCLSALVHNTTFTIIKQGVPYVFFFQDGSAYRLRNYADAGILQLPVNWPAASSIEKHFIRDDELSFNLTDAELEVMEKLENGMPQLRSHIVEAKAVASANYLLPDATLLKQQSGWSYNATTRSGDCGGLLIAFNPRLQHKFLGIHVAGVADDHTGFSVLITYEMICEGLHHFKEVSNGLPVAQSADPDPELYCRAPIELNGNFTYVGVMPDRLSVGLPVKTAIRKSRIHDKVFPHVTEPAILAPWDTRYDGVSPMQLAIDKYATPTIPFPPDDIEEINVDMKREFAEMVPAMPKRLLTPTESIYGNDSIQFCDRMNMSSSPGYPYVLTRPACTIGKSYLFDEVGVANEELAMNLELREKAARVSERIPSVWVDCLKDERRTLEKIRNGKTRQFTLPPVDLTILTRKYFMAFVTSFLSHNCKFFSSVGINPYSYEWTVLFDRLAANSNYAFAGDFSRFDGIHDPYIYMKICDAINDWYGANEPQENKNVRRTLFLEFVHTQHLCKNLVFFDHQGNPSGNPLTTVINTIMVAYYMRLSWLSLARLQGQIGYASIDFYHKYVVEACYGDDSVVSVKGEVANWFNQVMVASFLKQHGIVFTDEAKNAVCLSLRPLTTVTFLKNGFGKHPTFPRWKMAQICKDTIHELTNWVRDSDDPVEQLRQNVEDASKFAYFWGAEYYGDFMIRVNRALLDAGIRPVLLTFKYWDDVFRATVF